VGAIRQDLRRRYLRRDLPVSIAGAIEIACYDLLGQHRGVPVYELLGGPGTDPTVQVYGSGGLGAMDRIRPDTARGGFSLVRDVCEVAATSVSTSRESRYSSGAGNDSDGESCGPVGPSMGPTKSTALRRTVWTSSL